MALTLAQVQDRITAIEDAISTGQRRVSYSDKAVEFRSNEEMHSTLRWLLKKQEELGGPAVVDESRQFRVSTGDGYDA